MKTGEVATRLFLSKQTVRNWAKEWIDYLSPGLAHTARGVPLIFTDRDVQVLATVAACKDQNFTVEEIKAVLENDEHLVDLPPMPSKSEQAARQKIQLIPYSQHRAEIQNLSEQLEDVITKRDEYEQKLSEAQNTIADLREQLGQAKGELKSALSGEAKEDAYIETMQAEIIKLNREVARLELLLELEQGKQLQSEDGSAD